MPDGGLPTEAVVYVVDDDPKARARLRALSESVALRVETYTSGPDLPRQADMDRPGCLVLNVRMRRMGGLDLLEALRRKGCRGPAVFLGDHASVALAVRAMQAGASHFMQEPADEQELIDPVRRAVARDVRRVRAETRTKAAQARFAVLSAREAEVFRPVVAGHANKDIAHRLGIRPRTVEAHRVHGMAKLGAGSLAELVSFAIRHGLATPPDPGAVTRPSGSRPRPPPAAAGAFDGMGSLPGAYRAARRMGETVAMEPDKLLQKSLARAGIAPAATYTTGQVARVLGVSAETVRRLVDAYEPPAVGATTPQDPQRGPSGLRAIRIQSHRRIPHDVLRDWLRDNSAYARLNGPDDP
jgi:two-component system response regulator FixJ